MDGQPNTNSTNDTPVAAIHSPPPTDSAQEPADGSWQKRADRRVLGTVQDAGRVSPHRALAVAAHLS